MRNILIEFYYEGGKIKKNDLTYTYNYDIIYVWRDGQVVHAIDTDGTRADVKAKLEKELDLDNLYKVQWNENSGWEVL